MLELYPAGDRTPTRTRIGIGVEDPRAAIERLREAGFTVKRSNLVDDPDGNRILVGVDFPEMTDAKEADADRYAQLSRAVEAGAYTASGPVEPGPAMSPELRAEIDRRPMTAAALIARLSELPPETVVLVQGYEGDFSPISSISDPGPVQELRRDEDQAMYLGRFEEPEEARRQAAMSPDAPELAIVGLQPPELIGDPVQAVVLRREGW